MQKLLEEMTLEEKIGQIMMTAFDRDSVNGDIVTLIEHYYIGGVLLQLDERTNSKKLATLNEYLQYFSSNKRPLFIANELEVDEFTSDASIPAMPTEEFFHTLNNRLYTKQLSEVIGQELRDVGINTVMYPNLHVDNVGDLRNKVDSHAYHGEAAIQGLRQSNVVSFVTGFPSLDEIDSFMEPDRRKSNLYPFYEVVQKGVDVLTVAETSEYVINKQIRELLQYENVIAHRLSDDFTSIENEAEQIIHAINSGINLLILPFAFNEQVHLLNRVVELAKLGEVNVDALEESLAKLFLLKEKYNMNAMKPLGRPLTRHQITNVKEKVVRTYAEKVKVAE